MEQVRISRFADIVGVTLAEARNALAQAVAVAGDDALDVHGEVKGRGFVARRTRARKGEPWRFTIETPRQITHEVAPASDLTPPEANARLLEAMTRLSTLTATVAELREQLRLVERRAGENAKRACTSKDRSRPSTSSASGSWPSSAGPRTSTVEQ